MDEADGSSHRTQQNDHSINTQRSFFNILDSMKDLHENRDNALKWYSCDPEKIGL
jgi:hypothetical protein